MPGIFGVSNFRLVNFLGSQYEVPLDPPVMVPFGSSVWTPQSDPDGPPLGSTISASYVMRRTHEAVSNRIYLGPFLNLVPRVFVPYYTGLMKRTTLESSI